MSEQKVGFIVRCKNYFGLKPGQTMMEFGAELKSLTLKDKADLVAWFNAAGMPTEEAK